MLNSIFSIIILIFLNVEREEKKMFSIDNTNPDKGIESLLQTPIL